MLTSVQFPPQQDGPWAVGLSGGIDSVALLLLCKDAGFPVSALQFNHGFSDENGDEAEAFCRDLCHRLDVPLIVGHCTEPQPKGETKEVFARRCRMRFFAESMRAKGLRGLLLAHHAGDRAENLLLRLARGAGPAGLTSFAERGSLPGAPDLTVARPLLRCTRPQLEACLTQHGETWVEDTSNADISIPRNAIRKLLLPHIPWFTAGANVSADLLAEDEAYLCVQAEKAILEHTSHSLRLHPDTPALLARRALRSWLSEAELTRRALENLVTAAPGALLNLPGGFRVRRSDTNTWSREDLPQFDPVPAPLHITKPGDYTFGHWSLHVSTERLSPFPADGTCFRLPLPLTIRGRRTGDTFTPHGFPGRKKIRTLLIDLKVPAAVRAAYPLLCDTNDRILAVPGRRGTADLPPDVPCVTLILKKKPSCV